MSLRKRAASGDANEAAAAVVPITYPANRKNITPTGIEGHDVVRRAPTVQYRFNSHLPRVLRSSPELARADQARDNALLREVASENV